MKIFFTTARPELAEATRLVTPLYAAHWKTIGIQLHVTTGKLDAIEQEYPTNLDWCCDKMLAIWLEGDENASWQHLFTTVLSFNRRRVLFNKQGLTHTYSAYIDSCLITGSFIFCSI